jgi:hypothetical protein
MDQAQAVPSIEDRITAIIGADPDRAENLDLPATEPLPGSEDEQPLEAEEQPAAEEPAEEPADESPKWDELREVKLKVPLKNGDEEKELELSLDELRLGYMRQDDYQRKTQEVSKTRTEAQEQVRQVAEQVRDAFAKELHTLSSVVDAVAAQELSGVDWNRLSQENPAEFVRLQHRASQLQQAKAAIAHKQQAVEQQRLTERQQRQAQAIPQAEAELKANIPNWSDELRNALVKTAKEAYQRPDAELNDVGNFDPKYVQMLHDAHQWRQLQSQKPIIDKKVVDVPKVLKPGTKNNVSTDMRKLQELRMRIKKSGGKDKAAIEERIKLSLR